MSERDPAPTQRELPRPRRVTVAGVMAAVACVLVVVVLFDAMATVRSTQTPAGYRGVLRGLVLASGALAAAGAVLAVYALRRHRGARLGLTITSGLLVVSSLALADPIPLVVALGAAMMWSREARDWFDGRPPAAGPASPPGLERPPPPPPPPAPGRAGPPPASNPYAQPAPDPYQPPAPDAYAQPASDAYAGPADPYGATAGWQASGPRASLGRPVSVTVAAWLTWVFSGLTALAFLVVVAEMLAARDQLLESLHSNPALPATWDDRDILAALWVVSAVGIFWSLAAMALAVLAFRRVQIGRIALAVSAVVAALVGGVTIVGLLDAAAAVAVVVLLFTARANAWYAGRAYPSGPVGPSGPAGAPASNDRPPRERPPVW